jgi:hypothetical protein
VQIPNAVWLSIIAAAQMLVNTNFPDYWWSPAVLAALVAVGKLIQVNTTQPSATARGADTEHSVFRRWLVE